LNQGLLVKVKGKVISKFDDNSYVINDGSGDVLVFTDGYIVNQSGEVPVLKVGDTLEAVGPTASFVQGERNRVTDTKELVGTPARTDGDGGTQPGNGGTKPGDGGTKPGDNNGSQPGNNSGNNPAPNPVVTKPTTVKPTISGGVAKLFNKALEKASKHSPLEIDLGKQFVVKVELTKEQVNHLKELGIPLIVKNDNVEMHIPLSLLQDGKTLDVAVNRMKDMKDAVSPVYDFTFYADGKVIHQFAQPIHLVFDVDVKKVKNTKDLKVFYYNEESKLVPGAVYKDCKVEVATDHFSTFTVFEVADNAGVIHGLLPQKRVIKCQIRRQIIKTGYY
jgi:hypothetical protein